MKFKFVGDIWEFDVAREEMCQDVTDVTNVFLPTIYQTMEECAQTCPKFQKSEIPIISTKADYKSLQPKYQRWADGLGPAFWFRVTYSESAKGFIDWYTGEAVDMRDIRGSNAGNPGQQCTIGTWYWDFVLDWTCAVDKGKGVF